MTTDTMITNTHLLAQLDEALAEMSEADNAIDRKAFSHDMKALGDHVQRIMTPYRKKVADLIALLDTTNLPVGTRVRFRTTQGWDGSQSRTGYISKVSAKSYIINVGTYGEARVPRDVQGWRKRQAQVIAGPSSTAKAQAASRELAKVNEEIRACYHAVKVAEDALSEVRHARNEDMISTGLISLSPVEKTVMRIMKERHAEEWAALTAETEAAMYEGKPSKDDVEEARKALQEVTARTDAQRAILDKQAAELRYIINSNS